MIKKDSWVEIKRIILKPEDRANNLPEATKKAPLFLWVKGFLNQDAILGETVEITTITGRQECGELIAYQPSYKHNYGDYIPELHQIDQIVKDALFGGDKK